MSGPVAIVMGVSGTGKTTVGEALAKRIGARFVEGDAHHPPENRKAMEEGRPLDDAMRAPWLDSIARDAATGAGPVVVACSSLKRAYRDRLREGIGGHVLFVHLRGARALLAERMSHRSHFFPVTLLDSQLDTLEPPGADELSVTLDVAAPPEALVADAAAFLGAHGVSVR